MERCSAGPMFQSRRGSSQVKLDAKNDTLILSESFSKWSWLCFTAVAKNDTLILSESFSKWSWLCFAAVFLFGLSMMIKRCNHMASKMSVSPHPCSLNKTYQIVHTDTVITLLLVLYICLNFQT